MLVNEIIPLGKGKARVCFDDGTDLCLYKKELNIYNISEGCELKDEDYDLILNETLIPRAKKRAMHLLEKMDRTEAQLRDKLSCSGYPITAVDAALEYVKSYNYINDYRYALNYISCYGEARSRRRIKQDLLQKGMTSESIDRAIDEAYETDERKLAFDLIKKKKYDPSTADDKDRARMYRFLASRGFSASTIMSALNCADLD